VGVGGAGVGGAVDGAAFVGLVTGAVPGAAGGAWRRLRKTFHYEVTRAGVVYVLVTLVDWHCGR